MASSVSSVSQVNDLVSAIVKKFDTNGDGKLSTDEFGSFLTNLVGGLSLTGTATTTTSATKGSTASYAATTPTSATSSTTGSTGVARQRVADFAGFDMVKMADETHTSFKYKMARILQYYPNTPDGLQQALPEIQKLVPGAKITGSKGDILDFGDYEDPKAGKIGKVDVILSAGLGGKAWTWQPLEDTPQS